MSHDWVADVRRWYHHSDGPSSQATSPSPAETTEVGYEAAHPELHTPGWSEARERDAESRR